MSKHNHNYTQYSNKPKPVVTETATDGVPNVTPEIMTESRPNPVIEMPKVERPSVPHIIQETVETNAVPTTVEGVVSGCAKLNVRAEASLFADVVCVLDATSELTIDIEKSNRDWFYVCTAIGIEGYCMRKFVEARL